MNRIRDGLRDGLGGEQVAEQRSSNLRINVNLTGKDVIRSNQCANFVKELNLDCDIVCEAVERREGGR